MGAKTDERRSAESASGVMIDRTAYSPERASQAAATIYTASAPRHRSRALLRKVLDKDRKDSGLFRQTEIMKQ